MRPGIPVLLLALGVAACSPGEEGAVAPQDSEAMAQEPPLEPAPLSSSETIEAPTQCERDAAGQTGCFTRAFALERCDAAQVLGSTFHEDMSVGTHRFRTTFGIDTTCRSELEAALARNGFHDKGKGTFVTSAADGYRESVIFGLQVSRDGSIVEWERIQE